MQFFFRIMSNCITKFDFEEYAHKAKERVVIDAGHTVIGNHEREYFFGKNREGPSESEIFTLHQGLIAAEKLIQFGKQPVLHLCFSDTSKNFTNLQARQELKKWILNEKIIDILPKSYRELIHQYQDVSVQYTLQTQLSNVATAKFKKLKKKIKSIRDPKAVFEKTGAIFVSDVSKDTFGLLHPFLFDYTEEDNALGGDWWLDEMSLLHPLDMIDHPLLQAKKNGKILLYSKSSGILCPGTFSGLLFNLDSDVDFISIYSREDDPDIGEKVIGGVIAALSTFERIDSYCVQMTLTAGNSEWEISAIDPKKLDNRTSWDAFIAQLEERGFLEKFRFYG